MKRLALLLGLFSLAAHAQTAVWVSINYTPGAVTVATANSTTVPAMVGNCVSLINNTYVNSDINIAIQPLAVAAGNSAAPDSAPMQSQFSWTQHNPVALQHRVDGGAPGGYGASMAITVSAPGPGVLGVIPATPPTKAKDAAAAVNISDLCNQLEQAISRNLGVTAAQGMQVRQYAFPYLYGGNICFHTKETVGMDPSTPIPIPAFWQTGTDVSTRAPDVQTSCDIYRTNKGAASDQQVLAGGLNNCLLFDSHGARTDDQGQTFGAATTAPVSCTEVLINWYSTPTKTYVAIPEGDTTHNNQAVVNGRTSTLLGFPSVNTTLLKQAKAGILTGIMNALGL